MIILIFPQFLHRDAFSSKRIHRVLFKKLAWNKIWERLGAWVWSHRLSISKTSSAWKEGEERHSLLFSHGEEFQGVDFNQDPINRGASFYRHTESERWMENFATYRLNLHKTRRNEVLSSLRRCIECSEMWQNHAISTLCWLLSHCLHSTCSRKLIMMICVAKLLWKSNLRRLYQSLSMGRWWQHLQ